MEDEDVPPLMDDSMEESDDEGWEEIVENSTEVTQNALCLFCTEKFRSALEVFSHAKAQHGFDITRLKQKLSLDCFKYIKLINYIRQNKPAPKDLEVNQALLHENEHFLKPVITDDELLMFDIENDASSQSGDEDIEETSMTITKREYDALTNRAVSAEKRVTELEYQLHVTVQDMELMRGLAKDYLLCGGADAQPETRAGRCSDEEEDSYFSLYSHFGIHHEMLQDRVRTESYQRAICGNSANFQGKIVLDVGCGTGILSMFAATSGAVVLAVDMSSIIYQAMDIIRENKLDSKIRCVKGRMEDLTLPEDKVDIIISEWMGYFLLFEGMMDSVLYARDKYLVAGGMVLPNKCTLNVVAIRDSDKHGKLVSCWDNMYGFKMSCMKKDVVHEANVEVVNPDSVITDICTVKEFDLMVCSKEDTEFTAPVRLTVTKEGPVTALTGFFDCFFDVDSLPNKVTFSTGPSSPVTHWRQTVFYLAQPVHVQLGEVLEGNIHCRRKRKDPRAIIVTFEILGQSLSYMLE